MGWGLAQSPALSSSSSSSWVFARRRWVLSPSWPWPALLTSPQTCRRCSRAQRCGRQRCSTPLHGRAAAHRTCGQAASGPAGQHRRSLHACMPLTAVAAQVKRPEVQASGALPQGLDRVSEEDAVEGEEHSSPMLKKSAKCAPWAAASRSASGHTTTGELPPSSRVTGCAGWGWERGRGMKGVIGRTQTGAGARQ